MVSFEKALIDLKFISEQKKPTNSNINMHVEFVEAQFQQDTSELESLLIMKNVCIRTDTSPLFIDIVTSYLTLDPRISRPM